ncbi:expressed unknown protein [Seminavis robusta]|uniref:Uncharacterized protein n=1 Tax=Seminavis robusta TaxID=568900 RepID=A0A9N8EWB3_9STRA|nr:expressed unknown protein [Seminavis robusta]|eukprot:Sro2476_g328800.1 n/a (142) ;mRNA; r:13756-14181
MTGDTKTGDGIKATDSANNARSSSSRASVLKTIKNTLQDIFDPPEPERLPPKRHPPKQLDALVVTLLTTLTIVDSFCKKLSAGMERGTIQWDLSSGWSITQRHALAQKTLATTEGAGKHALWWTCVFPILDLSSMKNGLTS